MQKHKRWGLESFVWGLGYIVLLAGMLIRGKNSFLPLSVYWEMNEGVEGVSSVSAEEGIQLQTGCKQSILDGCQREDRSILDLLEEKEDCKREMDEFPLDLRNSSVRVLIKSSGYKEEKHKVLQFACEWDMELTYLENSEEKFLGIIPAGETYEITAKDLPANENGRLRLKIFEEKKIESEKKRMESEEKRIESEGQKAESVVRDERQKGQISIMNLQRSKGHPSYGGSLEVWRDGEALVLINEVSIEQYLEGVLPSEMPSDYPMEALKAQAICARTYIYCKQQEETYSTYHAQADDSTAFQVYNNVEESERSRQAVAETNGMVLCTSDGQLAQTYYYSTSCGYGSDGTVWGTENTMPYLKAKPICGMNDINQGDGGSKSDHDSKWDGKKEPNMEEFLNQVKPQDFEYEEPWYRWRCEVKELQVGELKKRLNTRYAKDSSKILTKTGLFYKSQKIPDFRKVKNIEITSRGPGGIAEELCIVTELGKIKVINEYNIRYILNNGALDIYRQDGSVVASKELLPSAFISLEITKAQNKVTGYSILGGGFGHGVGLSQNAAKHMAESGYDCNSILGFFYEDCRVITIEHTNGIEMN